MKIEKKLAEVFLPIPYEDETFANTSPLSVCFTSSSETHSGTIGCRIGWQETPSTDTSTEAASISTPSTRMRSVADTKMRSTIEKWYAEQLIDPMDPENGSMAPIIAKLTSSTPRVQRNAAAPSVETSRNAQPANDDGGVDDDGSEYFRLNEDLHTFCALHKFNANKRLELLIARFNSDLKLKDCRLVPHTEIEIEVPTDMNIFEDMLWIDPIDVQRYQGKKYLKHVYDIITNHCSVINRNFEHHDLLIGDTPPTLNGALEALANIFSPRRPLNPTRRTSNSVVRRTNLNDSDRLNRFNIVVNVVRANNIPYRSRSERANNGGGARRTSLASTVQNCKQYFRPKDGGQLILFSSCLGFPFRSSSSRKCSTICDGNIQAENASHLNGGRFKSNVERTDCHSNQVSRHNLQLQSTSNSCYRSLQRGHQSNQGFSVVSHVR